MKKFGEARRAAGETVNEILVEETVDVAAASLAAQWRQRPGPGPDDRSLTAGTLVEVNGQFAFGGAQFGQDAFDAWYSETSTGADKPGRNAVSERSATVCGK